MLKSIISVASVFILVSISCQSSDAQNAVVDLEPKEFAKKLSEKKERTLIDVRADWEYEEGHLVNAVNVNWDGDNFESETSKLDKSKPVFLYCYAGGRSSEAANYLRKAGFKEIYNLDGGIEKWQDVGLPVSKD